MRKPIHSITVCGIATLAYLLAAGRVVAAPAAPPGFNVRLVEKGPAGFFWRGGAPRRDTLAALAASAKERGVEVTLIDLRHPPTTDDRAGREGRLSPDQEAAVARQL